MVHSSAVAVALFDAEGVLADTTARSCRRKVHPDLTPDGPASNPSGVTTARAPGIVDEVLYRGDSVEVVVRVDGTAITARVPAKAALAPDQRVVIDMTSSDVVVLVDRDPW